MPPRQLADLNGAWECSTEPYEEEWNQIQVPSNWHLAGLPNYHGTLWYKRRFRFGASLDGKTAHLRFWGVDYYAAVWLNGEHIGNHEGYFQPFEFDITRLLKEDNVLLVQVSSPNETPEAWYERKRLIKGILNMSDCRPGAWSPDRGQDANTGGIWNSVEIITTHITHIDRIEVTPILQSDASASLNIDLSLISNVDQRVDVHVRLRLVGSDDVVLDSRKNIELDAGYNRQLLIENVKNPQLWWCWDRGKQNIYSVELSLEKHGEVLDRFGDEFGIREIRIDESGTWYLNGKRIFARGTNFLAEQWLSRYNDDMIGRDIDLLKEANVNAIRVHAHVCRKELYYACDRAGILVWQDFPLQWVYDDENPEFVDAAAIQVRQMVLYLYNHPSIVVWACQNEPHRNERTLDPTLVTIVRLNDPLRPAFAASTAESHTYPGWYWGHYYEFRETPARPLVTEFGAQALPALETLREMFTPQELFPPDWDKWNYHCFTYHETFRIAKVNMGGSIESFVKNSQDYQATLLQFAIESYRRKKYVLVKGLFQFMFVDCWPCITWSVLDCHRRPKKGFYALKSAYQPVLISVENREEKIAIKGLAGFALFVINDLDEQYRDACWALHIKAPDGTVLHSVRGIADVAPDSVTPIGDVLHPILSWKVPEGSPEGQYTAEGELTAADGRALSRSSIPFSVYRSPGWSRVY